MFISRKDGIYRRMTDKLGLAILKREPILIPSIIQPVISIDELMKVSNIHASGGDITEIEVYTIATVPEGKRWIVSAIAVELSSGVWTVDALGIYDEVGHAIWIERASSVTTLEWLGHPLMIESGWSIVVHVDGYTSTGNMNKRVLYTESTLDVK